jgi:UDP-glucose 4-epimerase
MKRLLITGSTGTLGHAITCRVAAECPDLDVILAMRSPSPELFAEFPNVSVASWNMFDVPRTSELLCEYAPDAIVHCAAGVRPSSTDVFDLVKANVESAVNLFRESCQLERCHFVHVSTGFVYREQGRPLREGDPIDTLHPYGASKAAADTLLRAIANRRQRHLTVVRPFSFTGVHDGGDRLFPSLIRCAAEDRPFNMSSGKQVRDFCAVQDVADAVYRILQRDSEPTVDVYNVGSGSRVTLRDLVEDVVSQLEIPVHVNFSKESPRAPEPMHLVADTRRAQNELGWRVKTSVVRAVWELGQSLYPDLRMRKPVETPWRIRAASI